jgi:hypothetical protein
MILWMCECWHLSASTPSESSHGEPFLCPLGRNPGPCRDASWTANASSTRNRTAPRRKREACCFRRDCECLARHFDSVVRIARDCDYLHCARCGVPFAYYSLSLYSETEEIESTGDSCSGWNDGTGVKRWTTSRWSSKWRNREALEELVHYRRRHHYRRRQRRGAKCAL